MTSFAGGFVLGVSSRIVLPALALAVVVGVARWGIARDKRRGGR